jgi:hypothetical protein
LACAADLKDLGDRSPLPVGKGISETSRMPVGDLGPGETRECGTRRFDGWRVVNGRSVDGHDALIPACRCVKRVGERTSVWFDRSQTG